MHIAQAGKDVQMIAAIAEGGRGKRKTLIYKPRGKRRGACKKYWRVKSVCGWEPLALFGEWQEGRFGPSLPPVCGLCRLGRFSPSTRPLYANGGKNATYSLKFALYPQVLRK